MSNPVVTYAQARYSRGNFNFPSDVNCGADVDDITVGSGPRRLDGALPKKSRVAHVQIALLITTSRLRSSGGWVHLPDGSEMVRDVGNTAGHSYQFGFVHVTRFSQCVYPPSCLLVERREDPFRFRVRDDGFPPARGPVGVRPRVFTARPPIQEREAVPNVIDMRRD